MDTRKNREFSKILVSTTGLGVLLIILVLANVIFSYANVRWDTTEDKIFSLSPGTEKILSELEEPVTVKFFYSKSNRNLPRDLKLYAGRVRDLLSEYEYASGHTVVVQEYDPKVDSDEEEWAQRYGVRGVQTGTGERLYCGLVFLAADQEETIAFLDPNREELLEYDITRIIHELQSPEEKTVGILTALPVFGSPSQAVPGQPAHTEPWVFVTELRKTYEVRQISLSTDRIDPAADLLVVLHPKEVSRTLQYAIDQYVLSGGNAIIFVDPYCVSDTEAGQQGFSRPSGSSLRELFAAWGISMAPAKVVADFDQSTQVRIGNRVESSPVMISARTQAFADSDVVTSGLERMLLPLAGAIAKAEDGAYEFEPLIRSSEQAALIEALKANLGTAAIRRDTVPTGERFNVAVRLRGVFASAFPAGPPVDQSSTATPAEERANAHLETGKETSNLIVVADADLVADQFFVRRSSVLGFAISQVFNDNWNFVANACEILTGSDALIGLRSRARFERPFTRVLELKSRAQDRWLAKEQELLRRVEETNRKLRELERRKDDSQRLILNAAQEAEIEKFKQERRKIKDELKEVRKKLRADIEDLGTTLKAINMFTMPLVVCLGGVGFALYRQRRMKRQ
jgi:ABC-type uncharacterized transport system involved in gliding motility auxiliary subunit